ncbi:general stress protein, partial [Bacillus pumilus]|uniref:general stress protein n=1 Tax=Bacillus pumilus TaxID=1408 RepID=UPI0011A1D439
QLKSLGVPTHDIYVLSHDDHPTHPIPHNPDPNTIPPRELALKHALPNIFTKNAHHLRNKIHQIPFSKQQPHKFQQHLHQRKLLLFLTHHQKLKTSP